MFRRLTAPCWRRAARAAVSVLLVGAATVGLWRWHEEGRHVEPPVGALRLPAVQSPPILAASAAWLDDEAEVIGVAAGGRHRAYLLRAFTPVAHHVVNDVLGGVPVTVSCCERTGCVRLFRGREGEGPLDVRTGGFLGEYDVGTMMVVANGWRYRQDNQEPLQSDAPAFPYALTSYERTTWKRWQAAHPDTDVYVGVPDPEDEVAAPKDLAPPTPPPTLPARHARLRDEAEVIGVVVNGKARAYRVQALGPAARQVVNDVLAGVPVTVTYCSATARSQVFRGRPGGGALDVVWGGFQGEPEYGGMLLRVGRRRYRQDTGQGVDKDAPPFPYRRAAHKRTTWKRWRDAHPETDVYVGPEVP